MSDRMAEDMSNKMLEKMSNKMPNKIAENMPDRMPEGMPNKMPDKMSNRMPQNLPITKYINIMVEIIRSKIFFKKKIVESNRWNRFFLETEPAKPNHLFNNRLYTESYTRTGKLEPNRTESNHYHAKKFE